MEIGDTVVHPRYGVGVIDAIQQRSGEDDTRFYYVIPKPSISSTIFVPVDAAEELGLRPVASEDKMQQAIQILSGEAESMEVGVGIKSLSWEDPLVLASIIRRRMTGPKPRYPKASEQHQLKRAKKLLSEELNVVLGLTEDRINALVEGGNSSSKSRAASAQ